MPGGNCLASSSIFAITPRRARPACWRPAPGTRRSPWCTCRRARRARCSRWRRVRCAPRRQGARPRRFPPVLRHDVAELLGRLQAALRIDGDKEIAAALDRFGPKLAGRDLGVLIPYRADHVARGQAARGDLVRIDPNAHRVIAAAEHSYLADATQAREFVLDLDVGVVTQVERIVAAVRRVRRDHDGKGRGLLLRGHARARPLPKAGVTAPGPRGSVRRPGPGWDPCLART